MKEDKVLKAKKVVKEKKVKKEKLIKDKDKLIKRVISTDSAPKAVGPYSQGICIKKLVYFSGQVALDSATGALVDGGITEQTKQVLKNIDCLLKSQNLGSENVIKTTVFLKNMEDFDAMNLEYANYFSFEPPARSCVGVAALPLGALVEIEIMAIR